MGGTCPAALADGGHVEISLEEVNAFAWTEAILDCSVQSFDQQGGLAGFDDGQLDTRIICRPSLLPPCMHIEVPSAETWMHARVDECESRWAEGCEVAREVSTGQSLARGMARSSRVGCTPE